MESAAQPMEIEAEYTLETPVKCRECETHVESIQVVRMLRTKTNFTSTLPRRGYMMICPACQVVVSAGLGSRLAIA